MATPHTIPSKLSTTADAEVSITTGETRLYITAILVNGTVVIDGVTTSNVGPVTFPSPVICKAFTPDAVAQVAYFEQ